jgi:hypothetical protein
MEQSAVIKFCFKSGKTATEVYQDLKNVYGGDCMSRIQVFRRFASFREGRESLEDDPRPGRPVSARSKENVEKARAIVMQDRRLTTRLLADCLGVGKETARQILERDLQKRNICSWFVPHSSTAEQSIGLNVVALSSSLLTKVVSYCKEL